MLKNVLKVLFSNVVLAVAGLINSFLFPVFLSVEDYVYYQEYTLYLSYINICHLGIASGMFLNYAGKKYRETERSQYKSEVYLICLVLIVFTILALIVSGVSKSTLLLCVALSIFPHCIIASFQALYQAWERFTGYAVINAYPKLLFSLGILLIYFIFHKMIGKVVVSIYVAIIWSVALYLIIEFSIFTKNIKSKKIFSKQNLATTGSGFLITLGNYVNLLFHSIDKQFVNIIYSTTSFAIYSFAMSLQNIMILFITALANPFYPRLAKGDIDKKYIQQLKEILIMFGAYSGCAYFAVAFIVKNFISKYIDSLEIVAIFFAVFPAMAVINVIYINLYKIKKLLRKYIFTLVGMLCVAALLNVVAVLLHGNCVGIAFATMISYYVWLIYSQRDFQEISITRRDSIYLMGFFLVYYASKIIGHDILGFFIYAVIISVWNFIMYRETIKYVFTIFLNKFLGRRVHE